MSKRLVEYLEKSQQAFDIDHTDLRLEIDKTEKSLTMIKQYYTNLKQILRELKRLKAKQFTDEYKEDIKKIIQSLPEIDTIRQAEVISKAINGLSNLEIAYDLNISEKGVKWHKTNAFRSLGVKSTRELIKRISEQNKLPMGVK